MVTLEDPELDMMGNRVYFEMVADFPDPVDPTQRTQDVKGGSGSWTRLFFLFDILDF